MEEVRAQCLMPPTVFLLLDGSFLVSSIRVMPSGHVPLVSCAGDLPSDGFLSRLSRSEEESLSFPVKAQVALPAVFSEAEVE